MRSGSINKRSSGRIVTKSRGPFSGAQWYGVLWKAWHAWRPISAPEPSRISGFLRPQRRRQGITGCLLLCQILLFTFSQWTSQEHSPLLSLYTAPHLIPRRSRPRGRKPVSSATHRPWAGVWTRHRILLLKRRWIWVGTCPAPSVLADNSDSVKIHLWSETKRTSLQARFSSWTTGLSPLIPASAWLWCCCCCC